MVPQQSFCHLFNKDQNKKLLLQKLFKLVCHFRMAYKKWKFSCHLWQSIAIYYSLSVTCYMLLAISIFISETCYYLQKLVSFARCCTSRNFFCSQDMAIFQQWFYVSQRINSNGALCFQRFLVRYQKEPKVFTFLSFHSELHQLKIGHVRARYFSLTRTNNVE